jgi:hypothetical protein
LLFNRILGILVIGKKKAKMSRCRFVLKEEVFHMGDKSIKKETKKKPKKDKVVPIIISSVKKPEEVK